MSAPEPLNLIVTGVGGQGNVLISQIIGKALVDKGFKVAVGETFGLSQRGGAVQSHIRISREKIFGPLIPEGRAHVVLGLEPLETLRILPQFGGPDVQIIVNSRPLPPLNASAGEAVYPNEKILKAALTELSAKLWWVNGSSAAAKLGSAIMTNIVLLGALVGTGLIPLEPEELEKAMQALLSPEKLKKNFTAFRKGMKLTAPN
ncbi:MAG: indolepyruvate oxidoreductase subunit beta [Pseudomonadota bacterium]